MIRLFRTLGVALVLMALGLGYEQIASRWLKVPESQEAIRPTASQADLSHSGPRETVEMAQEHLSQADWDVSKARIKAKLGDTLIYFNHREAVNEGEGIRVWPAALLISNPEKPDEQPLTLLSKSALIQFDEQLSLTEIREERVLSVALEDEVLIKGPEGMRIRGEDFIFSRPAKHIYSNLPIQFAYAEHSGSADSVLIELDMTDDPANKGRFQIHGISTIRLTDNIRIESIIDPEKPPATVYCSGSLNYDFPTSTVVLEQGVELRVPTHELLKDYLDCEKLTLRLEQRDSSQLPPLLQRRQRDGAAEESRLQPVYVKAETIEPTLPVRFQSDANDLYGRTQALEYDVLLQKLVLKSDQLVQVRQGQTELGCQHIEIVHQGQQRIESIDGIGPGRVLHYDPSLKQVLFGASWQQGLTMRPDDQKPGFDRVTLNGQAVLQHLKERSGIVSEQIHFLVQQPPADAQDKSNFVIDRMLAEGAVSLVNPQVRGTYKKLQIVFAEGAQPPVFQQKQAADPPIQQTNFQTEPAQPSVSNEPETPILVDSNELMIQVLHDENLKTIEVREIVADGQIVLRQQPIDQPQIVVEADKIVGTNLGHRQQTLHVKSLHPQQTAYFGQGTMRVEGNDIQFNRQQNTIVVQGRGFLRLPVKQGMTGEVLSNSEWLDLWWSESMEFDGQTATFIGEIQAVLGQEQVTCEKLVLTLLDPLSFEDLLDENASPKVELSTLECQDRVKFTSLVKANGIVQEFRQAEAWKLVVNQQTGEFTCQGPGILERWTRGNDMGELSLSAKPKTETKQQQQQVNYARVEFADRIVGNLHQGNAQMREQINVVYGPVSDFDQRLTRDRRPQTSGWLRCDLLDLLMVTNTQKKFSHVELAAHGNVEIEAETFRARADRVTFNQQKDLYTVQSSQGLPATVWQRAHPGAPESRMDAPFFRIIPSTGTFHTDRSKGAIGVQ